MSKVMQVEIETKPEKSSQESAGNDFWLFSKQFLRRHGLHLLGTTTTWFLLYFAFYSQNLFQKRIFSAIGWIPKAETMNALEEVYGIVGAHTLIGLCSTMAGYLFTVAIDKIGRFAPQNNAACYGQYDDCLTRKGCSLFVSQNEETCSFHHPNPILVCRRIYTG